MKHIQRYRIAIQTGFLSGSKPTEFSNIAIYTKYPLDKVERIIRNALEQQEILFKQPLKYSIPASFTHQNERDFKDFVSQGYKLSEINFRKYLGMYRNKWIDFAELNGLQI